VAETSDLAKAWEEAPGARSSAAAIRATPAASLASFYVGTPDDQMLIALYRVRSNLEAGLSEAFGAEVATAIAQAFVATVIRHRAELETAAETPRVLN
jgi:hypothetical protein